MTDTLIEIRGLTKVYGMGDIAVHALRGVALSILRALHASTQQGKVGAEVGDSLSERLAREIAYDLERMTPQDQRRVIDLMKRLRGDRGEEEADHVPLGTDL